MPSSPPKSTFRTPSSPLRKVDTPKAQGAATSSPGLARKISRRYLAKGGGRYSSASVMTTRGHLSGFLSLVSCFLGLSQTCRLAEFAKSVLRRHQDPPDHRRRPRDSLWCFIAAASSLIAIDMDLGTRAVRGDFCYPGGNLEMVTKHSSPVRRSPPTGSPCLPDRNSPLATRIPGWISLSE